MNVLLIRDGIVVNTIAADSTERAAQFYPDCLCIERPDGSPVGPGWTWDGTSFAPPGAAPAPARRLTRLAFRNRFTPAEKIALYNAAAASLPIRVYLDDVNAATFIDPARPETRAGVQALESAGIIAAGRALQILDAPVTDSEAYQA